jgi:hypothetical protein
MGHSSQELLHLDFIYRLPSASWKYFVLLILFSTKVGKYLLGNEGRLRNRLTISKTSLSRDTSSRCHRYKKNGVVKHCIQPRSDAIGIRVIPQPSAGLLGRAYPAIGYKWAVFPRDMGMDGYQPGDCKEAPFRYLILNSEDLLQAGIWIWTG